MMNRSAWSWAGPILVGILIIFPTAQYGDSWVWWVRGVAWSAGLLFFGWGTINGAFYIADYIRDAWKDWEDAKFKNSPAGTAQAIRNLTPVQVQLLLRLSGGAWIVKLAPEEEQGPQYLLAGAEEVPIEFVKFVLDRSNEQGLYPQNRFNDQAYDFDPVFRLHTDRDLYMSLQLWLSRNDMIEWPRGNQPARWKNGWSPAKLAQRLDLNAFTYGEPRAQPLAIEDMEIGMQQGSGIPARLSMK